MTDTLYYNDYKWVNDPWPWMNHFLESRLADYCR